VGDASRQHRPGSPQPAATPPTRQYSTFGGSLLLPPFDNAAASAFRYTEQDAARLRGGAAVGSAGAGAAGEPRAGGIAAAPSPMGLDSRSPAVKAAAAGADGLAASLADLTLEPLYGAGPGAAKRPDGAAAAGGPTGAGAAGAILRHQQQPAADQWAATSRGKLTGAPAAASFSGSLAPSESGSMANFTTMTTAATVHGGMDGAGTPGGMWGSPNASGSVSTSSAGFASFHRAQPAAAAGGSTTASPGHPRSGGASSRLPSSPEGVGQTPRGGWPGSHLQGGPPLPPPHMPLPDAASSSGSGAHSHGHHGPHSGQARYDDALAEASRLALTRSAPQMVPRTGGPPGHSAPLHSMSYPDVVYGLARSVSGPQGPGGGGGGGGAGGGGGGGSGPDGREAERQRYAVGGPGPGSTVSAPPLPGRHAGMPQAMHQHLRSGSGQQADAYGQGHGVPHGYHPHYAMYGGMPPPLPPPEPGYGYLSHGGAGMGQPPQPPLPPQPPQDRYAHEQPPPPLPPLPPLPPNYGSPGGGTAAGLYGVDGSYGPGGQPPMPHSASGGGSGGGGSGGGGGGPPGSRPLLHPEDRDKDMGVMRCRNCGEFGHMMRYCPGVVCFTCHTPGHMASVCPFPATYPPPVPPPGGLGAMGGQGHA
jgi:hypothetical protein